MIRKLGFPSVLLVAWLLATAYTMSLAIEGLQPAPQPQVQEPQAPAEGDQPAS